MKKIVCGALSLVLAACCLTACGKSNEAGQNYGASDPGTVTDFEVGDVELHESILPMQFEEGEAVENVYYKRTTDETGTNAYAVLKAADNQVAYLPMSNTVVYMGDSDDCYFERTTNTYKLDGEDQTVVQYQLYVANGAPSSELDVLTPDSEALEENSLNPDEADGAEVDDLMLDEDEFPVETEDSEE